MESPEQPKPVVSPFAQTTAALPTQGGGGKSKIGMWVGIIVLVLAIGGMGSFFAMRHLNDPYRTLETFPVDKYLLDFRSLSGARFKGVLKVEADLGWNADTGKLMVFSSANGDSRPFVVLVPPKFTTIAFTKGQTYIAELEVREGGLIYANSCEKN